MIVKLGKIDLRKEPAIVQQAYLTAKGAAELGGKPLSAKADSFSLPNPNKGGREVRVVYETPTTNVSRSDSISG